MAQHQALGRRSDTRKLRTRRRHLRVLIPPFHLSLPYGTSSEATYIRVPHVKGAYGSAQDWISCKMFSLWERRRS